MVTLVQRKPVWVKIWIRTCFGETLLLSLGFDEVNRIDILLFQYYYDQLDNNSTMSGYTLLKTLCRPFSTTRVLLAEPPRKKRRMDPAMFKIRVEKKMKKLEREITKLEKEPRQLIPILEYQLTNSEIKDLKARPQHTMEEFGITEASVKAARRLWNFHKLEQSHMMNKSIRRIERAQTRALEQLKELDIDLFNNTVAVDDTFFPYRSNHMRKETPPNPNYVPPDGYIKDVTKEWVM